MRIGNSQRFRVENSSALCGLFKRIRIMYGKVGSSIYHCRNSINDS